LIFNYLYFGTLFANSNSKQLKHKIMKRALFVLVIVLMAATTYNQTPRRATSTNATAGRTETRSATSTRSTTVNTQNNPSRPSTGTQGTRSTGTSSSTTHNNNQNPPRSDVSTPSRQDNQPSNNNSNRTYGNQQNNPPRTSENHANNDNRYDNDRGHDRDGNNGHGGHEGQQVEAHHYNNVNANTNVHTEYPSTRVYRGEHHPTYSHHEGYRPEAKSYREVHYIYREPVHYDIIWTREMHRTYCEIYPEVHYWHYDVGYRIASISAYRADFYIGEVMNVYGQVSDIFYAPESDEYFLYIGPYYPYQDFTVVIPGWIARNYSLRPVNYFLNQYICVTGLITAYNGTPEIDVKRNFQVTVY
jgi:hypothetical protein